MNSATNIRKQSESGFTLIEMSIVLLILGLLLGTILKPLGASFQQVKRRQAQAQLEQVVEALIGFSQIQGRLPCPATSSSGAQEPAICTHGHGFVPAAVLGVAGRFDKNGKLLDPWNKPLRYSVSLADSASHGNPGVLDFVTAGEMQQVGMKNLKSDLVICSEPSHSGCPSQSIRANQVPAVVYSVSDGVTNSMREMENLDLDNVFLVQEFSEIPGEEFNDVVLWISENVLITRLTESGVLP